MHIVHEMLTDKRACYDYKGMIFISTRIHVRYECLQTFTSFDRFYSSVAIAVAVITVYYSILIDFVVIKLPVQ